MTTPRSTRITVPVVASNGGEYQISYERPGPVEHQEHRDHPLTRVERQRGDV